MKKNIVNFLKKSKKKARQEESTKPLMIKNQILKNKVLKQTSKCCYSSKNVKPSKFMFKIYTQSKT